MTKRKINKEIASIIDLLATNLEKEDNYFIQVAISRLTKLIED